MLNNSKSFEVLEERLGSSRLRDLPAFLEKGKTKHASPEPNYMKSTRSSSARKEKALASSLSSSMAASGLNPAKTHERKTSLSSARMPVKESKMFPPSREMATCSSIMREKSFPSHLDLAREGSEAGGASIYKVCPYKYCSLNGRRHRPSPSLKSFISARRRLMKTQKSLAGELLSSSVNGIDKETVRGGVSSSVGELIEENFPIEIYANYPKDGLDVMNSESGSEKTAGPCDGDQSDFGFDGDLNPAADLGFDRCGKFSPSEIEILVDFLDYVECDGEEGSSPRQETVAEVYFEEMNVSVIGEVESARGFSFESEAPYEEHVQETEAVPAVSEKNFDVKAQKEMSSPTARDELINIDEEPGEMQRYSQRAPNFLPDEPRKTAEKVDLRHQTADDRRNSDEWMVDYALRRAVDKLAPRRRKKVELLVEAFETVLPPPLFSDSAASQPETAPAGEGPSNIAR